METNERNYLVIRWSKLANGERLPLLFRRSSGLPIQSVTFWSIAARRTLGMQPNTLFNELRSLMVLFIWADSRKVDIDQRIREGEFLTLSEIIDLVGFCEGHLQDLLASSLKWRVDVDRQAVKTCYRSRVVKPGLKRDRLSNIRNFLEFLSADQLSTLQSWDSKWLLYNDRRNACFSILDRHIKAIRGGAIHQLDLKEGVDPEIVKELLTITAPDHPDNPFSKNVRLRNHLIFRLFAELGIRRSELLNIYVLDCSITDKNGTVTIHRRPDDINDPRTEKPANKTSARVLPISNRTSELVHEWVVRHRSKLQEAKKHPFLITSTPSGAPMSLSSINKIFQALRGRVDGIPDNLSPHLLRHSWNDAFSNLIDSKSNISPEEEIKWRKRLMGWSSDETAGIYLRRTVRKRSNEFLKKMQDGLIKD
ncbi:tyrosine-type recombinase/integrase [Donghicola tyrosinivorans]|uniref:Site-specific recombinase XerD n=1 Tax=Donghicola tyrosinivorans TaxID=1652492 RepID=A0A2T0X5Z4_9RHOB|nr:site-specific integrase [Donghicola tyrosinivorans]PRY94305.1 site-specific recombinase XerD [Donghicola tyrosinivorans]